MQSTLSNVKGEQSLIRALIIARGHHGASLQDIKNDYKQHVGEELKNGLDDYSLRMWLQSLEYISVDCHQGQIVYYSDAPEQLHLTEMVRRQKSPKAHRKPLINQSTFDIPQRNDDARISATPKTWARALVFRRSQFPRPSHQFYPRSCDEEQSKKPRLSENNSTHPPNPAVKRSHPEFNEFEVARKRFAEINSNTSEENESECETRTSDTAHSNMNATFISNRIAEENYQVDPFLPEFHKCVMVGDNFFLNLAMMDLGFRMLKRDQVLQSGFCVSGQTIDDATKNIPKLDPNQIILVNIGSIDIIQGKELIELIYGMIRLIKTCEKHEITPILSTIPPLANYRLGNRAAVTDEFNKFIMKNPFNFPVIELHKVFLQRNKWVDYHCYQPNSRYVSGLRKPIVFWNRMGREKVMKTLNQQMGSAMLKLMVS